MKLIKTPISLKNAYYHLLATATVWLLSSNCEATNALTQLSTQTMTLSNLVMGPLGKTIIVGGTIGGIVGALVKGSMWVAVGIFIIGLLLGWHMENVAGMFAARG
jgi:hypothetical protein